MNIKSNEKKENSTIELVIEVTAEEFEAALNKAYNKRKKSIAVPGFRKGKAPRKISHCFPAGHHVTVPAENLHNQPDAFSTVLCASPQCEAVHSRCSAHPTMHPDCARNNRAVPADKKLYCEAPLCFLRGFRLNSILSYHPYYPAFNTAVQSFHSDHRYKKSNHH